MKRIVTAGRWVAFVVVVTQATLVGCLPEQQGTGEESVGGLKGCDTTAAIQAVSGVAILHGLTVARDNSGVPGSFGDVPTTANAVWTYTSLGSAPLAPAEIVAYLDSQQQADGTFGRGAGYAPELAQAMIAYHLLGAEPATPLDGYFATVDTWDEVLADNAAHGDPQDFWGGLWGYVFAWLYYYQSPPPWIDSYFARAEATPDTWLDLNHQRAQVIAAYVALDRPIPFQDTVIQNTIASQNADGSWTAELTGTSTVWELAGQLRAIAALEQVAGAAGGLAAARSNARSFLISLYVEMDVAAAIAAYFRETPGAAPEPLYSLSGAQAGIVIDLVAGNIDPLLRSWMP